jgi:orotidine-5'-phosphate decarboxylase
MPRSPIVVVGYGAQEGTLPGCVACFDERGAGAVVNASRSLTYGADMALASEEDVVAAIRSRTEQLGRGIGTALTAAAPSRQPTVE